MGRRPPPCPFAEPGPLYPILTQPKTAADLIPVATDPTGRGMHAWEILSRLRITEGEHAGKTIGEHHPAWQPKLTKLLFGHTNAAGRRMIREAFITMAKKGGKSSYCAALAITKLMLAEERREQVILLASSKEQARIVFDAMVSMIRADMHLAARFGVVDYRSTIRFPETDSTARAVAAEMEGVVGFNASCAITDELHILGLTSKGQRLVAQIRTGSVSRKEPLLISISTAPPDRSEGIFQSTMDKARRVISGEEVDPHFAGWICEVPSGLDPEDPQHWHWANPSIGYTISLERLQANYESAKSDPSNLAAFMSQNVNQMPDGMAGIGRWLSLKQWDEAADPTITFDRLIRDSVDCFAGIDLGSLDDLSALLILGRTADDCYLAWCHLWVHRQGYEKRVSVNQYDEWIAAGELTRFEDGGADLDEILDLVKTVHATGKLRLTGTDAHGATDVATMFSAAGIDVRNVPGGWRQTSLLTWVERKLADNALRHDGSPVFRWCMANAVVTRSGNARQISKATAINARKIDACMALLHAAAAVIEIGSEPRPYYTENGLLILRA